MPPNPKRAKPLAPISNQIDSNNMAHEEDNEVEEEDEKEEEKEQDEQNDEEEQDKPNDEEQSPSLRPTPNRISGPHLLQSPIQQTAFQPQYHQYPYLYPLYPVFAPPSENPAMSVVPYVDASMMSDPPPDAQRNRGGVTEPFPEKLHRCLDACEREGLADVFSFFVHGRAFAIHKHRRFETDVMPRFFRQTKITSFQRQLNLYGFRRISQGPDNGGYYHQMFLKGRPGLCINMKRTKIKGAKDNAKHLSDIKRDMTEPNFYTMPPVTGTSPAPLPVAYMPPQGFLPMAQQHPHDGTSGSMGPMASSPMYPPQQGFTPLGYYAYPTSATAAPGTPGSASSPHQPQQYPPAPGLYQYPPAYGYPWMAASTHQQTHGTPTSNSGPSTPGTGDYSVAPSLGVSPIKSGKPANFQSV